MKVRVVLLAAGVAGFGLVGCKKTPGGGGGGGGGWLVGSSGLMANIQDDGTLGPGYDIGATENLNGIACRYQGEAWVVGDRGTLLYTNDAGHAWVSQTVPTDANLRALATQDNGPVFVAGDGVFLTSTDTGANWTSVATTAHVRSIAAAQRGTTVLAISDDGAILSYANGALTQLATIDGAKAVAISPDGATAVVAGNGLSVSNDGGATWNKLAVDAKLSDVNVVDNLGTITAVGEAGAVVHVSFGAVSVQHVGAANLRTVHLTDWNADDESIGYAAGDNGAVLVTHDGGWSWDTGPNVGKTVLGADQIGLGHR